ncbi:MAG: GNAT family N-acetyltransferase [Myxococcota bacterium]
MVDAVLTTSRLWLRPLELSDAAFLVRLNADPLVVRFTGDVPFATLEHAEVVVRELHVQWRDRGLGRLGVVERRSERLIGWCGLKWHESEEAVDLGFRFLRSVWGQGFATEAGAACLARAQERGLRVFARADLRNAASVRVLEKLAFHQDISGIDAEGFARFHWSPAR